MVLFWFLEKGEKARMVFFSLMHGILFWEMHNTPQHLLTPPEEETRRKCYSSLYSRGLFFFSFLFVFFFLFGGRTDASGGCQSGQDFFQSGHQISTDATDVVQADPLYDSGIPPITAAAVITANSSYPSRPHLVRDGGCIEPPCCAHFRVINPLFLRLKTFYRNDGASWLKDRVVTWKSLRKY